MPDRVPFIALVLSLGVHALVLALVANGMDDAKRVPLRPTELRSAVVTLLPPVPPSPPEPPLSPPAARPSASPASKSAPKTPAVVAASVSPALADRAPAYQEAPPAPTAQEWAQAATYTLKNSKRYRHTWGQQVRSMMGTAYQGVDQGVVRFRVEIAPDGRLARLETLWSTSDTAERLARQAVERMPPLPPTPTGKPLIFERTISFQPFEVDGPPIYRHDCEPDPPGFTNPFAWDGRSPRTHAAGRAPAEPLDPQAMAECLRQLPQDSIEAETRNNQQQIELWSSPRLGR